MKNNYFLKFGLILLVFLGFQMKTEAQVLVHYWNFNDSSTLQNLVAPTSSLVTPATITHVAGGTSELVSGTGQNFDTQNLNAQNGDVAGAHLRFNNPIGGTLIFDLPTTGFDNVIVKFTTRRSGQGAGTQIWSYTTNGTDYTQFANILPVDGNRTLQTLDFSAVAGVENNANFKLKVEFQQGSGGTGGNNRFDNFTVEGMQVGGADTFAPVTTIEPMNNAINVAIDVNPTISFNENVRLVNNDAITNANASSVVELRIGNATGAMVPFTTTFENNTITIIPTSDLQNNQNYYVAVLANSVEDFSNNAVAETVSNTFTTIAVQTVFNPGDLVIVGYRMNASGAEDEIAILTLVDILPGTFFTLTDSKFTSNAVPQCPNGIVWTAGSNDCIAAGTIITIQTSAQVANIGTLSGSTFGLSSGGDQVIIYAGSFTNPNYITALSSNGWVADNTSCSGSLSMLPTGLVDGVSALNTSTAPGNIEGNAVNAFYDGPQVGDAATLKTAILNPANWVAIGGSTPPQTWPNWNFPSNIQVVEVMVLNSTSILITFNTNVDTVSGAQLSNYTGLENLTSAVVSNNQVTLNFSSSFASGIEYGLEISGVQDTNGNTLNCPFVFGFSYDTTVALADDFLTVNENEGTISFTVTLENPSSASVDLVVKTAPFSTADAADFTFATQTLTFNGNSDLAQSFTITILDDTESEQKAEYFVITLENPQGLSINGNNMLTVYIIDNDSETPSPSEQITLDYIGSFDPSGDNSSTTEIVSYDPTSQRLFTTSAVAGFLDIINFSNPNAPTTINSIDMNVYGGITSVAVKNGVVAVASPNQDETLNGSVVFFDTDGNFLKQVTVGALPDMIVFSPDGSKVLTANEGQPNENYSIDPEGSVSVIDISNGIPSLTQDNVSTLLFTQFNADEAALIASGVRKLYAQSTLSQDFEPEFITISADSQKAWIALQENNAIAVLNLNTLTYESVWALGTKDMSLPGNGFDASDNNDVVLIANWPVQSFFIPDAIASYEVNGTTYIVTANEGDEKEYGSFTERVAVSSSSYVLDETIFPQAQMLKKTYNLGRFRATNLNGNTDADAAFEAINSVGARSFSIFNTTTGALVFDSGDDFERYTSEMYPSIFNSDHEENAPKGRSRAKGPEPEGVTVATIAGETFAFVSLERVGGVMVYNVTDPANAVFVDYNNPRNTTAYGGDNGPEGITFISAADSPNEKDYVLVANEISGTITIYEVNTANLSSENPTASIATFNVFPNPAKNNLVYFNKMASYTLFDMTGKAIKSAENALTIETTGLSSGMYLIKTTEGQTVQLLVP